MATQDQIEVATSPSARKSGVCCSNGSSQSETLNQLQKLYTFNNDYTPKARKPYTITKQREKWTEEDHQKFLEALRLYGRGWRQIEGKCTMGVVRDSNGGFGGSITPIEIPPPRPKRKPVHPYPRKSVNLIKGKSPSTQPERSPTPNQIFREQEIKSPTSVLSDVMGSSDLEQQKGCSSPTSCTTNLQSINTSPIEKETDHATSNLSTEEEKAYLSSVKVFGHSAVENILSMNRNADLKDFACAKVDDAAPVAPSATIKLFGKTVKVKDSPQPFIGEIFFESKTAQEDIDGVSKMLVQALPSTCLDTRLSLESTDDAPLPSWAFYQGLPFGYITSFNQTHTDSGVVEKDTLNDRSCSGSNTGSVSEPVNRKGSNSVDSKSQHLRPSPQKCSKGFVPYKRCLTERDMSSSVVVSEE
ncbi:Protein REVEILLE 7-like [Hibiscus syriacus]|uniref:Protein REVEILLE 7-like n=1 Tax=Hibiscus syriacus TaxID=106335 RepID=A0A6A2XMT6_HIBSY|nr:Protein REVEILLE 7-like [Hibiscus syriacus]